ncbi:SDR family oxidoreductase [Gordonia neofelifaecis]|uniref:NAD-dependent epimerase/dehydratase n=1 Tax=Gordonia neofelifaecis NRRL B-59395 TaxID=644548 RepID=F1YJN1_9ACTN|nr:SDR family oxidoreductase [Gordonia neofelifaecis]EGD54963.1 NAD-dependent epimerase/dehydratase [Gordonia neofelifaecis NRRL B-59395]
MGKYVVTGAASGMGNEVARRLRADGHEVIGVDLADSEVIADLSTSAGRSRAVREIMAAASGRLDGAVFAAGVGAHRGKERLTVEVNVLGVTELLMALQPELAAAGNAKVVVFGSNSTTSTPFVPRRAIKLLESGDTERATRILRRRGALSGPAAYAASKIAVSRWTRRHAMTTQWAGSGIRVNILAPGPVLTPLLRAQLESSSGKHVRSYPVPVREYGTPEQLAQWVLTMLSPAADFMAGSVITVDGGTEALLRPNDWPSPLPLRRVPRMLSALRRAPRTGQVADYSAV